MSERGNEAKFIVLYLSPGDYHRFHSPAVMSVNNRRHVPGYLCPVRPSYLEKNKDGLKDNERATLFGQWGQGFFAMTMVGALNVGSIVLNFDQELHTNMLKPKAPFIQDA